VKIKSYFVNFMMTDFTLAWQLLTVIPLPLNPKESNSPGRSVAYYPLIGLVLGGILAGTGWLLYPFLPAGLTAALLLALWAGLTGLLHLDGFMDSCDGLLPPRDPARRLEIMKDSRVGAFGVVGVMLLLLIKFNGLAALSDDYRIPALVTIPVLARWGITWVMTRYPPARQEGMGVFFGAGLGRWQVGAASATAVIVAFVMMGWLGLALIVAAWITATLIAWLAMARISGLTGDVYGAICEVCEAILLTIVVAVMT
jgi:adenosylcobinamide-GDP ribazoletransferase